MCMYSRHQGVMRAGGCVCIVGDAGGWVCMYSRHQEVMRAGGCVCIAGTKG